MLNFADSRNFSRTFAALGLILSPVLFAVATAIDPAWSGDEQAYLGEVASNPTGYQLSALLFLVGTILLVPGLVGVVHLLRGRRVSLGQVGASLVLAGAIVLGGFLGINIIEATATQPTFDRNQVAALLSASQGSGFALVFPIAVIAGLVLGSLLLAVGLFLRRAVPVWVPALLLVQVAVGFTGSSSHLGSTISFVLLAVVLGAIGVKILLLSDAQWGQWQVLPDRERRSRRPVAQPTESAGPVVA